MRNEVAILDYGHARRRLRRALTWAVVITVASAAVLLTKRHGLEICYRVKLLSLQRQCRMYQPPKEMVVLEEDPDAGEKLVGLEGYSRVGGVVGFCPPAWQALRTWQDPGATEHATAFLHERQSPSGLRRVVAVDLEIQNWPALAHNGRHKGRFHIRIRTWEPRWDMLSIPAYEKSETIRNNSCGFSNFLFDRGEDERRFRAFAAQPDSNDLSGFRVKIQFGDEVGTIKFNLRDDGRFGVTVPLLSGISVRD